MYTNFMVSCSSVDAVPKYFFNLELADPYSVILLVVQLWC